MKFICEYCEKQYDDHDSALLCEKSHEEEVAQEREREERNDDINLLINNFIRDYKMFPDISIDEDKRDVAVKSLIEELGELIPWRF